MKSNATNPDEYLAELPSDRREALEEVRETILANLPNGLVEVMAFGMIAYVVPLDRFPDTYNGQPALYAALASQKHHMAVYLTAVYANQTIHDQFVADYKATGRKLDMGKSCVRFRNLDQLPLDVVGDAIGSMTCDQFIAITRAVHEK